MEASLTEREEIEALLPWFATRRLGTDDQRRVERYLEQHPEMKAQLPIVRTEMDAAIATAEACGAPGAGGLDRLMREVAAAPAKALAMPSVLAGAAEQVKKLLEAIAEWLASLSRVQLGSMAAAASLLIAVQAGSLLFLSGEGGPKVYETASGPREAGLATGTFAIVAFKPGATAAGIAELLESARAEIVEGPKAGIWRIRLSRDVKPPVEAEALLARLRNRTDLVAFTSLAQ